MDKKYKKKLAKMAAEAVFSYCGMAVAFEQSEKEQLKKLSKAIEKAPDRLVEYLSEVTEDFSLDSYKELTPLSAVGEAPHGARPHFDYEERTENDTSYGDIAMWITSFISQNPVLYMDFTDDAFYDFICEDLKASPEELRFYLSEAVDNCFICENYTD